MASSEPYENHDMLVSVHDDTSEPKTTRVSPYGWDYTNTVKRKVAVDEDGNTQVSVVDSSGASITPAQDDTIILLRRLVKLLESNAVVDIQGKQRITIDSITNTVTMGTNLAAAGGGNGISTVPVNVATIYQPVWEGPVDQRFRIMNDARNAYANSIRANLSFT